MAPTVLYIGGYPDSHTPGEWEEFCQSYNVLHYDCDGPEEFIRELQAGGRYSAIDAIMRVTWFAPQTPVRFFHRDIIQHYPASVKICVAAGHGYEHVDMEALNERKIYYCNSPDTCTQSTADIGLFLILSCYRLTTFAEMCLREGRGRASKHVAQASRDPGGSILAIIGLGGIGKAVAKRALALGMHIHYYTRTRKSPELEAALGGAVYHADKESLLKIADCVLLACPYSKQTHHVLDADAFSLMKPGVRVVNIARGACIDEPELVKALVSGKVASAGLDVFENDPNPDPRLCEMKTVTLLPHIGGSSNTSFRLFESCCINNIQQFFLTGKPATNVNSF